VPARFISAESTTMNVVAFILSIIMSAVILVCLLLDARARYKRMNAGGK
jgi:hypothetical protein